MVRCRWHSIGILTRWSHIFVLGPNIIDQNVVRVCSWALQTSSRLRLQREEKGFSLATQERWGPDQQRPAFWKKKTPSQGPGAVEGTVPQIACVVCGEIGLEDGLA